jgi:hypothetical protein
MRRIRSAQTVSATRPVSMAVMSAALLLVVFLAVPSGAAGGRGSIQSRDREQENGEEIIEGTTQWGAISTAPGVSVDAAAYLAAQDEAAALPVVGGAWSEVTTKPYDLDATDYRDPFISNSGGGWGFASGRMTAVAVDPANANIVYAGAAGGGVWKSTDQGVNWSPVFDDVAPSIAIGAVAIDPADGSVWVGTGENNTAFENHRGSGIYVSNDGGGTWAHVGGTEVDSSTVGELVFDETGKLYAATSRGLFVRDASDQSSASWTRILYAPDFGYEAIPYGLSIVNDVAVRPGTDGQVIIANMAWRSGAAYNGMYISRDGGQTFTQNAMVGAVSQRRLGRASLAYSADGSKLYAVVQDDILINSPQIQTGNTVLAGVYVSSSGDPGGPWSLIANYRELQQSGSALNLSKGYAPGVQAWYNQFIGVDPADRNHVYLGLEEVFETRDGGTHWSTIGPYWNFSFSCWSTADPENCPRTTHPDQHGVAFGGGYVYVANDGGIWARSLSQSLSSVSGWLNRNETLRTLQYYYAASGIAAAGNGHGPGEMIWGGLQDNGVSLLNDRPTMVSPFGGDGGDNIVDPNNADRAVNEYTVLDMWKTTVGGFAPNYSVNAYEEITPSCFAFTYTPDPCDPNPRFIAPFRADPQDINHWVAGGQYVWDNEGKGWGTSCSDTSCDWQIQYDTGAGDSTTAIAVDGDVTYVGWCGPSGCNPSVVSTTGAGFLRGLATNYGGTWHEIDATDLPNRYVSAVVIDPNDPAHVWAAFGGFSRRWIDNAGTGHVFESTDAGVSWTDVSGDLPDVPARDLIMVGDDLILGTDVGVYTASTSDLSSWSVLGADLPHAVVDDLSVRPSGEVLAATHGRGLWSIALP